MRSSLMKNWFAVEVRNHSPQTAPVNATRKTDQSFLLDY
jgi:hypothetical protein